MVGPNADGSTFSPRQAAWATASGAMAPWNGRALFKDLPPSASGCEMRWTGQMISKIKASGSWTMMLSSSSWCWVRITTGIPIMIVGFTLVLTISCYFKTWGREFKKFVSYKNFLDPLLLFFCIFWWFLKEFWDKYYLLQLSDIANRIVTLKKEKMYSNNSDSHVVDYLVLINKSLLSNLFIGVFSSRNLYNLFITSVFKKAENTDIS